MDIEYFFKKTYTVAYRLTGDVIIAEEIATQALSNIIIEYSEDYIITESLFQYTVLELIKIFLKLPKSDNYNNELKGIQISLLKLKPINRAVVIWKDVLGYQISDNMPVINYNKEELIRELKYGRKNLKEYYYVLNE